MRRIAGNRTGAAAAPPVLADVRDHAAEAAEFLKALANDQRLLVLCSLMEGPLSVGEINARVPLSQSALSQHLAVLREARLVVTTRHAQAIHYAIADGPALEVMRTLYGAFCRPAPPTRGRQPAKVRASAAKR